MKETQIHETQGVISPGATVQAFACKVKSHVSHNVYKVRMVEIGPAGTLPVEMGAEMEAIDLSNDFSNRCFVCFWAVGGGLGVSLGVFGVKLMGFVTQRYEKPP